MVDHSQWSAVSLCEVNQWSGQNTVSVWFVPESNSWRLFTEAPFMAILDVARIQSALRSAQLDGWLLYDFHGSNPIARRIARLSADGKLTTRRWYYLIPAVGEPRSLVHNIEQATLVHLPGERVIYADRNTLRHGLTTLLHGLKRVALEYSPGCEIPYLSRVDAGTIDLLRQLNVEPVSSGDLVQLFEAVWSRAAFESHKTASRHLYAIKDRAFQLIRDRLTTLSNDVTEYMVQQQMVAWFEEMGLVTDCPPVVAAHKSSSNPHYLPTASDHRTIGQKEVVLLDLWGKLDVAGAVYADITWVGYTGTHASEQASNVFGVAKDARDAAVNLITHRVQQEKPISGWEVDCAAREVISRSGYGNYFTHRTGHSLGQEVHGNGVHMDDYETHDERRIISGSGFTIEPGIYLDTFGVRTEINMYVEGNTASVTGPLQSELVTLS